jgi:hypothetical protein
MLLLSYSGLFYSGIRTIHDMCVINMLYDARGYFVPMVADVRIYDTGRGGKAAASIGAADR